MGTKPLKSTRADRRLKENKTIPPYADRNSHIKNKRIQPEPQEIPVEDTKIPTPNERI